MPCALHRPRPFQVFLAVLGVLSVTQAPACHWYVKIDMTCFGPSGSCTVHNIILMLIQEQCPEKWAHA